MERPFDPRDRDRAISLLVIKDRFGDRVGTQAARLDDDELEELMFRIACGEYGS